MSGAVALRQAPAAPNAVRPSGLPILSTEKLTAAEIARLKHAAQQHRLIADAIDGCLEIGRVDVALSVFGYAIPEQAAADTQTAVMLGSNR